MPERGKEIPAPAPGLPDAAARLVERVRDAHVRGMFPPVVTPGPQHTWAHDRDLRGERDARLLARTLTERRFAPVAEALRTVDDWCAKAAPAAGPLLAPGVLAVTDAALFGPLISDVFTACALGQEEETPQLAAVRTAQWTAFLDRFLARLHRDLPALTADRPALRGPVTALWACGDETHNDGRRVLRLTFAGGGRLAYKDRPAGGEALFLAARQPGDSAPASVFELLNGAPPASGKIRLPVLSVWSRHDGTGGYSWQEWIEPIAEQGVLHTEDGHRLTGTVLAPDRARDFWRHAGSLAAVCFGLGIADLTGDNVLAGRRPGQDEDPMMYPVDVEVFFADVRRLHHTGLTGNGAVAGTHHVGFESRPRWCAHGGSALVWRQGPDGTLELAERDRAFTRTNTRSVVADTAGGTGYGAHLPAMLRGMFDAWTLLCRHRDTVLRSLAERAATTFTRIVPRPTGDYHDALAASLRGRRPGTGLAPAELAQLARGDVPYFFRTADGGPPLVTGERGPAEADPGGLPLPPALDAAHHGARLTLAGLGAALRDAAEGVFDEVTDLAITDPGLGVALRLDSPHDGHVSFDWPATGRRVTYLWSATTLRLRLEDLTRPPAPVPEAPAGAVRRRLLRLDQLDAAWRTPWAADHFADAAAGARLDRLTTAGLGWLRTVVAEHGWPGRSLVGAAAAAAAGRLVQHATGDLGFRRHCLELVRAAAETGDMPRRDVAYLTDAIRLAEGRPQRYGTKFERVGGRLRPCPLEEPETVDERRTALGLEPLEEYARRLRATFPGPPAGAAGAGTADAPGPAGAPAGPGGNGAAVPAPGTDDPEAHPPASPHPRETP